MIIQILALDEKNGIGKDNQLPWPFNKEDMKFFKETTSGHDVLMGRNTWESLPKKPLPNRKNYVITSSIEKIDGHAYVIKDLSFLKHYNQKKKMFIIGGSKLYHSTFDITDKIMITKIKGEYDCDTFYDYEYVKNNFTLKYNLMLGDNKVETWVKRI